MAKKTAPYLGKSGTVDLDEAVFGEEFNMGLVHETARAELNARRRGTASTLTRGEVSMTTAKAFRQKGTGRARAGSSRSPLWSGGGTVFGPSPRHYVLKVNRKARRAALRSALSLHAERGSLFGVDAGAFDAPSTKQAAALLEERRSGSTLVVLSAEEASAAKSFRNLSGVVVLDAENAGVADIVRPAMLVASQAAVDALTARAANTQRTSPSRLRRPAQASAGTGDRVKETA
jgi:large subunit ribosomal protein L4